MREELPIIQKTCDMLLWLIPKLDKFPKRQKYLLGERIERTALDFLEMMYRAKYSGKRKRILDEANITFEMFKTLVRLSVGLNLMSGETYKYLSLSIVEIGKMLGGWMKTDENVQKPIPEDHHV
jgi:hypothetical protein